MCYVAVIANIIRRIYAYNYNLLFYSSVAYVTVESGECDGPDGGVASFSQK